MSNSFLDAALKALIEEETSIALETGRGKHGTENIGKRVGICIGLTRAQEIIKDLAKKINTEDELET